MHVITDPWQTWVNCTTHTATTNTDIMWHLWHSTTGSIVVERPRRYVAPAETPQEWAAREARREQFQREQRERMAAQAKQRDEAAERARALLVGVLSEAQRQMFEAHRWIVVKGRSGRLYRVRRGSVGNVDVLDNTGNVLHRLCAHPHIWTPDEDVMLAQLLHLQHDDDAFCRVANLHPVLARERVPSLAH